MMVGELDLSDVQVGIVLLPTLSEVTRKGPHTPASFTTSELGRTAGLVALFRTKS